MFLGLAFALAGLLATAALRGAPADVRGARTPSRTWLESRAPEAFDPAVRPAGRTWQASYRADATLRLPLLFFSIPLVQRRDVGFGSLAVHEYAANGERRLAYEFFAASRPERARGLARMGFMREAVAYTDGSPEWTAYFGVMTASPEKTADEARRALEQAGGRQVYAVADGLISRADARIVSYRAPFEISAPAADTLYRDVRPRLQNLPPSAEATSPNTGRLRYDQPLAFLGAIQESLRRAARGEARKGSRQSFVHERRVLTFELTAIDTDDDPPGDPQLSAAERRTIRSPRYRIIRPDGSTMTSFRLWIRPADARDGAAILPLAFTLEPRSFLRLTFVRLPPVSPS